MDKRMRLFREYITKRQEEKRQEDRKEGSKKRADEGERCHERGKEERLVSELR